MIKKILCCLIITLILICGFSFSLTANAQTINKGVITVGTASAVNGDSVIIPISIKENPGIMAISISITYDSSALEYEKYYVGSVINDYTVVDHPKKNLVRYVGCDNFDRTKNDVLINLQFKVKDTAEFNFYKIDVICGEGDLCNWNLDKIIPTITSGGIDIAYNGNNCSHKYGDWSVAAAASCEEKGKDQRICSKCGHTELKDTQPIGHEYSDKFTVDQPATETEDGVMSRHCIRCNSFVDRITYSLSQSTEGEINNNYGAEIPTDEFIEEIFKEQNPDKELSPTKPEPEKPTKADLMDKIYEALPFLKQVDIPLIALIIILIVLIILI